MNAPLVAVLRRKGVASREAKQAVVSVMRTMVGYLPEPEVTRVRGRLSQWLSHRVGEADFPIGNRFAPPDEFFRLVAEQSGFSLERARELSRIVVEAWSRIAPPELLGVVAGYMPAVIHVLLPERTDLVTPRPKDPLQGDLIPLCTAPVDSGWKWHAIGATGSGSTDPHILN